MSTTAPRAHDFDDGQFDGVFAQLQGVVGSDADVIDITITDVDPLETRVDDGVLYIRVPRHALG